LWDWEWLLTLNAQVNDYEILWTLGITHFGSSEGRGWGLKYGSNPWCGTWIFSGIAHWEGVTQ